MPEALGWQSAPPPPARVGWLVFPSCWSEQACKRWDTVVGGSAKVTQPSSYIKCLKSPFPHRMPTYSQRHRTWEFTLARPASSGGSSLIFNVLREKIVTGEEKHYFSFPALICTALVTIPFFFFFSLINRCFLVTSPTDTKPCLWSLIKPLAGFYRNWNLHSIITIATIIKN